MYITGHSLSFLVAETYGEESTSILETAELWKKNISAFIGPQETCLHEARMAAAFNLPMISYVSQYKNIIIFKCSYCIGLVMSYNMYKLIFPLDERFIDDVGRHYFFKV